MHAESLDRRLRQQAAGSPLGNMLAATVRLNRATPFGSETPAGKLMAQIQQGEMPVTDPSQWLEAMTASGLDRSTASQALTQEAANREELTPELVDTIRRKQYDADVQPLMNQYLSRINPAGPQGAMLMQGAREEAARGLLAGVPRNNATRLVETNQARDPPAPVARVDRPRMAVGYVGDPVHVSIKDVIRGINPTDELAVLVKQRFHTFPPSPFLADGAW